MIAGKRIQIISTDWRKYNCEQMEIFFRAVFVCILITAVSCQSLISNSCEDPLVCYLNSLQFNLPSFCTSLPNGKDLCVDNFICKGIQLSSIPSEYKSPTTLGFGIHGAGTSCTAKTKYGRLPGEVSILIKDTSLDADLFIRKKGEYASSLRLTYCNVSSIYVGVDFSDPILEAFAGQISSAIEQVVYKATCVALNAILMTNVTHFVTDTLNPALAQISASPASPYPVYGERYMDWNQSIVTKLHSVAHKVHGMSNLPDFVRCMVIADNGNSLWQMMNSAFQLLPWDTGLLPIDGWRGMTVFEDAAKEINVSLAGLSFSGIDTLGDIEILDPLAESKVTMRSAISFGQLAANVSVKLSIKKTLSDGQVVSYEETVQLGVIVKDISLTVDLTVALDDHFLESMYLDQLSLPGCWVQPITEISIPNLNLWLNPASVTIQQISGDAGALEHDIVELIDNTLLLLLSPKGFNQLVQDVLHGAIQGPVRQQINIKIADALTEVRSAQPCLSHYPYNDQVDLVDWQYSKLIKVLNGLLNQYFGPAGLNQIMLCATQNTGKVSLETRFLNIDISGLDSFYAFSLLAPVASTDYLLASTLGLGFCDPSLCKPLTVTISSSKVLLDRIANSLSASLAHTIGTYKVSISLSNLYMSLASLLKWNFNAVRDLQQKQLSYTGCLPSTLQNASMQNASLDLSTAQLVIDSNSMTLVNRDITRSINALLSFFTQPQHLETHNEKMEANLEMATATCANNGVKPQVEIHDNDQVKVNDKDLFMGKLSWQWELFVLCVGSTACLAGLLLAYNYWGSSRPHPDKKQSGLTTNGNVNNRSFMGRLLRCLDYGASLLDYDDTETDTDSDLQSVQTVGSSSDVRDSSSMGHWRKKWHEWHCQDSLIFHRRIPLLIRIAVPLVICTNIFLFIQSNLAADAVSVMVSVTTGTTVHEVGSIFDFGLGGTVHDMWNAGVYPLAILIAFFSGAWPYVKLLVMMLSWIVPPGMMSKERRETMLVILDMLGKWSLVDFFVMVLMLCAFYFELVVYPEVMLVTVTVKPAWGFYSFLLATMISLGLGHTILACHRLVTEPKLPIMTPEEEQQEPLESLCTAPYHLTVVNWDTQEEMELLKRVAEEELALQESQQQQASSPQLSVPQQTPSLMSTSTPLGVGALSLAFDQHTVDTQNIRRRKRTNTSSSPINNTNNAVPKSQHHHHHTEKNKYFKEALGTKEVRITRLGSVVIAATLVASMFCLLAGVYLKSMGFHFEGLTGYMLKSAQRMDYSYISIGTALPSHSGVPNSFAIRWLQASYFLFGVAMPACFLCVMLVLWVVPLTLRRQRQLHVLSEVFNAWSTLDVFCVSIVAALLEIQQFAAFIVGDSCDGINKILAKPTLDEKLDGDDKCFDVQAYVKQASWVLFLAAGLLLVLGVPSLAAAHHTIKRRLDAMHETYGHRHHSSSSSSNTNPLKKPVEGSKDSHDENELHRRLLGDEEALSLGIHPNNAVNSSVNIDNSDVCTDSNLSNRPLLETFSSNNNSLYFPTYSGTVATPTRTNVPHSTTYENVDIHSERDHRDIDVNDDMVVQKSERWIQREERALLALQRHRAQHKYVRYIRQCCSWQAMYMSVLQLFQFLQLLTIVDFSSTAPSDLNNSDACYQSAPPQSPALHFVDIYQQAQLSPVPFPYSNSPAPITNNNNTVVHDINDNHALVC